MTKSEFMLEKQRMDEQFRQGLKDDRRWVIGTIIAVGLGLAGLMVALLHH